MMKYSFIIPVYNCRVYLPACIASIRAADLPDYEILLIDDGSTDGSGELCEELAICYPEIRVIHQENAGASGARNRGILESAGNNLIFVDADDTLDPEELRQICLDPRCIQTDLTVFGMTFDYYKNGACYRRDPLWFPEEGILLKAAWGTMLSKLYECNALSPVWNKVFQREILIRFGLRFDEKLFLYEDFEFVLRYLQHCENIWNVPKAIYHYRQSEDEGNAVRRLARIDCIPEFLGPIETALEGLRRSNVSVTKVQTDRVLQQLYLVLAREKISGSRLPEIRKICRDFSAWSENRDLPEDASVFQKRLQTEKAALLLLASKKSALRHRLAVWVKSHIHSLREKKNG